jgi:hypothetical protein
MKEESLKKIMQKSSIETSDDFMNTLMNRIEVSKEEQKVTIWNSFRHTLVAALVLLIPATGILFKLLRQESSFLSTLKDIPATPIFVITTLLLLFGINSMIRLQNHAKMTTSTQ